MAVQVSKFWKFFFLNFVLPAEVLTYVSFDAEVLIFSVRNQGRSKLFLVGGGGGGAVGL